MRLLASVLVLVLLPGGSLLAQEKQPRIPAPLQRLIDGLEDADASTRWLSAIRIGNLGSSAVAAVPALTKALWDKNVTVRGAAVRSLGRIGPVAARAAPQLVGLFKDTDAGVRADAAWALSRIRADRARAVPALLEALRDGDKRVRAAAALALGAYRDERGVRPLIGLLQDAEPVVRKAAVQGLGDMQSVARPAFEALLNIVKSPTSRLRGEAVQALRRVDANRAVPILIGYLSHPQLRRAVRIALRQDPVGRQIVDLTHPFASTRRRAAQALGRLRARDAVPALALVLRNDSSMRVRIAAARSLARMGKAAIPAVSALTTALNSKALRIVAAQALGAIGPQALRAVPALRRGLEEPDERYQFEVALALGKLGKNAAFAVTSLIDALQWGNQQVREASANALGAIGPQAKPAVKFLIEALRIDTSWGCRTAAARALGKIGPDAKAALPALRGLVAHSRPELATAAQLAVQLIQKKK